MHFIVIGTCDSFSTPKLTIERRIFRAFYNLIRLNVTVNVSVHYLCISIEGRHLRKGTKGL